MRGENCTPVHEAIADASTAFLRVENISRRGTLGIFWLVFFSSPLPLQMSVGKTTQSRDAESRPSQERLGIAVLFWLLLGLCCSPTDGRSKGGMGSSLYSCVAKLAEHIKPAFFTGEHPGERQGVPDTQETCPEVPLSAGTVLGGLELSQSLL